MTLRAMAEKIKNSQVFLNPFSKDNPVIVQVLGICSVLAVTAKLAPAMVMRHRGHAGRAFRTL
ncbi:MAG: hypothetical protein K2N76_06395 [Muribaculaceae bacterium]|nr:hypothetical protein [Muribaculaceae bacterium]